VPLNYDVPVKFKHPDYPGYEFGVLTRDSADGYEMEYCLVSDDGEVWDFSSEEDLREFFFVQLRGEYV